MTRVVSISPNAIESDSRTFKFAASVARLGHEAIVVETEASSAGVRDLPFELIGPPHAPADEHLSERESEPPEISGDAQVVGGSLAAQVGARLPGWLRGALRPLLRRVVAPVFGSFFILRANVGDYVRRNRQIATLLPDADVYWLHTFWVFPAVYLKARRVGARLLYDAPDSNWEPGSTFAEDPTSRAVVRTHEAIERFFARRAERFSTVSNGVANLLEARFGRRPEVILNCHDFRMDQPSQHDVREAAGVGPEDFLLVMSGNLKPGTAIEEGLEALAELPPHVHLAFLGLCDAVTAERIEAIRSDERAHLLDPVPPREVVNFMRSADASPILYREDTTNYRFALPNGFFHALSAGLPILYPPLVEMRAMSTEHGLGVEIDPVDPPSIAAGVRALIDDPEATAAYRANSATAAEQINWEHEERLVSEMLDPDGR